MKLNTEWTSCLEASLENLVSRLVSPEPEGGRSMSDTSGLKCAGSFARLDPAGCWLKTSRDSSASVQTTLFSVHGESLEMFSGTWPRWGIVSDGVAMALEMWGRPTSGIGSSSWLTPSANDSKPSGPVETEMMQRYQAGESIPDTYKRLRSQAAAMWPTPQAQAQETGRTPEQFMAMRESIGRQSVSSLAVAAQMWPAPNVPNGGRKVPDQAEWTEGFIAHMPDGKKVQVDLNNAVKRAGTWPTPRSSPNENRQTKLTPSQLAGKHGLSLAAEVNRWATPAAADSTGSHGGGQGRSLWTDIHNLKRETWSTPNARDHKGVDIPGRNGKPSLPSQIRREQTGQLNPAWVEALQGFSPGWTDVPYESKSKTRAGQPARKKNNTTGSPPEPRRQRPRKQPSKSFPPAQPQVPEIESQG